MIQTCAVACYSIAVGGGFGSYLLGLNKKTFEQSGGFSTVGKSPSSIKEPGLGWMTGFLFLVCFIGLFVLIPLQKPFPLQTSALFGGPADLPSNHVAPGNCWAFSAMVGGLMENTGCSGGLMENAFDFINKHGVILVSPPLRTT